MKKIIILILLSVNILNGQQNFYNPVVQPPSISNFTQFVDVPVDLTVGLPEIKIPISSISNGDLDIPIELKYHADGIRIVERADWVGLKWYLNTGGEITRTVKHVPDEFNSGYFYTGNYLSFEGGTNNYENMSEIYNGYHDSEPDIFTYSIQGFSGKFFLDKNGNVIQVPLSDLKIEYEFDPDLEQKDRLKNFTITDPKGNKYFFGQNEQKNTSAKDFEFMFTNFYSVGNSDIAISWKLMEIQGSAKIDNIIYDYETIEIKDIYCSSWQQAIFEGLTYPCAGVVFDEEVNTGHSPYGSPRSLHTRFLTINKLKSIKNISNNKKIVFITNTVREDCDDVNAKSLDYIEVYQNGKIIAKYNLIYDYYHPNNPSTDYYSDKRLRLTEVKNLNPNDETFEIPGYKINYNSEIFPGIMSTAKDHWGYYNGAHDNPPQENVPYTEIEVNFLENSIIFGGADREPHEIYNLNGMLNKIILPTGGELNYEFEQHDYYDFVEEMNIKVGGLRIKKITLTDENSEPIVINYKYSEPESENSSGLLVIKPKHIYTESNNATFSPGTINSVCGINVGCDIQFYLLSEDPINEINSFDGRYIYYSYVREKYSNESSKLIHYENSLSPQPDYHYPPKPVFRNINHNVVLDETLEDSGDYPITSSNYEYIKKNIQYQDLMGKLWGANLQIPGYCQYSGAFWALNTFQYESAFNVIKQVETVDEQVPILKEYTYREDDFLHRNPTKVKISSGTLLKETEYKYAHEMVGSDPMANTLIERNITGIPLETTVNEGAGGGEKVTFIESNDKILPKAQYSASFDGSLTWDKKIEVLNYNSDGLPVEIWNKSMSNTVGYLWENRILKKKYYPANGSGRVWDYQYYPDNFLKDITDNAGIKTSFQYDDFKRLHLSKAKNGLVTNTYTYYYKLDGNAENKVSNVISYPGSFTIGDRTEESIFDDLGRGISDDKLKFTQDNNDFKVSKVYNNMSWPHFECNPSKGGCTEYIYWDRPDQKVKTIKPAGSSKTLEYVYWPYLFLDGYGGNYYTYGVFSTDENGIFKWDATDIFGRKVLERRDANGLNLQTTYSYNDRDQVTKITPPNGVEYKYEYYPDGLLYRKFIPDKGWTTYTYNAQDQVKTEELPNGHTLSYEYNSSYNDLLEKVKLDGAIIKNIGNYLGLSEQR